MTGPARTREPIIIDGERFFKTDSGLMVNISELVRISDAVEAGLKPGMTDEDIDKLITDTVNRMRPN